jgi:hypothetical protein
MNMKLHDKGVKSEAFTGSLQVTACASAHGGSLVRSETVLKISFDHLELSIEHPSTIQPRRQITLFHTHKNRGHSTSFKMARGNQRDKAREANQKKMADQVSIFFCANVSDSSRIYADSISRLQKKSNNMSGSEMQREKEKVAAKMREKQAAGKHSERYFLAERI